MEMRALGIDLGSRFVKLVIYEDDNMVFGKLFDTISFYRNYSGNKDGNLILNLDKILPGPVDKIVSTGYGRNNVRVLGAEVITELKAHALGATLQTGWDNFVLLDIGGQDSKVMLIENGRIADMMLNDKCAASSGRYLENMASLLKIPLEELTSHYQNPISLNSTCAVFAESELIGYVSEGMDLKRLCAGVNYSLFNRIRPMLSRFSCERIVSVGGVAYNKALQHYIKSEGTFRELRIPDHPHLNGAIGCCHYALRTNRP
jgi:predicted CoA-substrate-specific enzyme activase